MTMDRDHGPLARTPSSPCLAIATTVEESRKAFEQEFQKIEAESYIETYLLSYLKYFVSDFNSPPN